MYRGFAGGSKPLEIMVSGVPALRPTNTSALSARSTPNVHRRWGNCKYAGRCLIFMPRATKPVDMIEPDFTDPGAVWISGMEITNLKAGKKVRIGVRLEI